MRVLPAGLVLLVAVARSRRAGGRTVASGGGPRCWPRATSACSSRSWPSPSTGCPAASPLPSAGCSRCWSSLCHRLGDRAQAAAVTSRSASSPRWAWRSSSSRPGDEPRWRRCARRRRRQRLVRDGRRAHQALPGTGQPSRRDRMAAPARRGRSWRRSPSWSKAPTAADRGDVAGFAYLSLVGTALAFVLWFNGIRRLPTSAPPLLGLAAPDHRRRPRLAAARPGALGDAGARLRHHDRRHRLRCHARRTVFGSRLGHAAGTVAGDGDAMHDACRVVVGAGVVGRRAVVPDSDVAGSPTPPHDVLGVAMCSYSSAQVARSPDGESPSMCDVNDGLTNRPRSPVSGWTRTTGWRAGSRLATRCPIAVVTRPGSARTSGAASCTAASGSTSA